MKPRPTKAEKAAAVQCMEVALSLYRSSAPASSDRAFFRGWQAAVRSMLRAVVTCRHHERRLSQINLKTRRALRILDQAGVRRAGSPS